MLEVKYIRVLSVFAACLILLFIFFLENKTALAKTEWSVNKTLLEKATNAADCEKIFEILWPHVKEGNVEATEALLFSIHFGLFLNLPGRDGDYISRIRDVIILAANIPPIEDSSIENTFSSYFKSMKGSRFFIECRMKERSKDCASILVDEKIIPSFSNYTREIDALLAWGFSATCTPSKGDNTVIIHNNEGGAVK